MRRWLTSALPWLVVVPLLGVGTTVPDWIPDLEWLETALLLATAAVGAVCIPVLVRSIYRRHRKPYGGMPVWMRVGGSTVLALAWLLLCIGVGVLFAGTGFLGPTYHHTVSVPEADRQLLVYDALTFGVDNSAVQLSVRRGSSPFCHPVLRIEHCSPDDVQIEPNGQNVSVTCGGYRAHIDLGDESVITEKFGT